MDKNNFIILAIIVAVLGGIYFFSSGKNNRAASLQLANTQNSVVFNIDAKRFQFTPDTITVKKGQSIKIIVNNTDTTHGINVPDFNVAGNNSIEFTANRTGEFTFYCNTFCGNGHGAMQGKIVVTD